MATCDKDLKRRIRKIPGVPIMSITQRRYNIERMPDDFGGVFPLRSCVRFADAGFSSARADCYILLTALLMDMLLLLACRG